MSAIRQSTEYYYVQLNIDDQCRKTFAQLHVTSQTGQSIMCKSDKNTAYNKSKYKFKHNAKFKFSNKTETHC